MRITSQSQRKARVFQQPPGPRKTRSKSSIRVFKRKRVAPEIRLQASETERINFHCLASVSGLQQQYWYPRKTTKLRSICLNCTEIHLTTILKNILNYWKIFMSVYVCMRKCAGAHGDQNMVSGSLGAGNQTLVFGKSSEGSTCWVSSPVLNHFKRGIPRVKCTHSIEQLIPPFISKALPSSQTPPSALLLSVGISLSTSHRDIMQYLFWGGGMNSLIQNILNNSSIS